MCTRMIHAKTSVYMHGIMHIVYGIARNHVGACEQEPPFQLVAPPGKLFIAFLPRRIISTHGPVKAAQWETGCRWRREYAPGGMGGPSLCSEEEDKTPKMSLFVSK